MKIRHKQSGVVLEGQFCECEEGGCGRGTARYFHAIATNSRYDRNEWEEVKPEPVWMDVTSRFEVQASGWVAGDGANGALELFGHGFQDYRIRKVRVADIRHYRHALVIERMEQP